MKHLHFCLFLVLCGMADATSAQVDDPAARICLGVLTVNMRDTNNVFSDEYHFTQYQNILKQANFSSYQQYAGTAAGLGIDIPIADALIGFNGDYKTNNGTFQQQMSSFLNSTYSESLQHSIYSQQQSTINANLLSVAKNCQDKYFDTLKERMRLAVDIQPNDYDDFLVSISGYIPQTLNTPFVIDSIEPDPGVTCTSKGAVVQLPLTVQSGQIVMDCKKDAQKQAYFAISSNLGNSVPILLPKPPAPTPVINNPTIKATWSPNRPATGTPLFFNCPCVSVANDPQAQNVKVVNNCSGPVPILYLKDTDANGQKTPEIYSCPGRSFAYLILNSEQSAVFDMTDAKSGIGRVFACPGVPTLAAPPPMDTTPTNCRIDPTALPPGTPPSMCPGPPGGKNGDSCACPKFIYDSGGHLVPAGTYPGSVQRP